MNIRDATPSDATVIADFNRAIAHETEGKDLDSATVNAGVAAVFADETKGFYVVAEDEGEVVGSLMITYEWSDWRNAWFWWIQSVYIKPEYRGKKIYRLLYDFVKAKAAKSDVCGFRLYAETENTHAQAVYLRVGMEKPNYVMFEESL